MAAADPLERKLIAILAGTSRWAGGTADEARAAMAPVTAAAAEKHRRKWLEMADPDGKLSPEDRERAAALLRKQHMTRLALKSVQARKAKASTVREQAAA